MASQWARAFVKHTRFDYIKLRFPDVHPIHLNTVNTTILAALEMLLEEYPGERLSLPKHTTLPPSANKPNGKYIIELFGLSAEAVKYMPHGWAQFVTYAHVKCYGSTTAERGIMAMKALYEEKQGPRSFSVTYPGTMSRTSKGSKLPSLRSGSRKSGQHGVIYKRTGAPVGMEARFRDEQVANVTLDVLQLMAEDKLKDNGGWDMLRYRWAQMAAEFFERDFLAREEHPSDWFLPGDYTDCFADTKPAAFEAMRREAVGEGE